LPMAEGALVGTVPKNLATAVRDYQRLFEQVSDWIGPVRDAIVNGTASPGVLRQLADRVNELKLAIERIELLAKTKTIADK
jgi:hypothetical protein